MTTRTTLKPGMFYVMDSTNGDVGEESFTTARAARKDADECNIAEDLVVGEAYATTGRDGRPCVKLRPV